MNKLLIIAAVIGCIALSCCDDHDDAQTEMSKVYGIKESWVNTERSRQIHLIGELKMIREFLQKQVQLETARQRASGKVNPLCEPVEIIN